LKRGGEHLMQDSVQHMDKSKKIDSLEHEQMRARRPNVQGRLKRDTDNKVFAGVLAGIADFTGANPTTVRIIFVVATLLSAGIVAIGYVLLWMLLPSKS